MDDRIDKLLMTARPHTPNPEQARRMAEGVARRAVASGQWTQEEADAFLAGVEERLEEREAIAC